MSEFVGKEATVRYEVTSEASITGVVVEDNELGVTVRREYRKGVRLERIPRNILRGVFVTEDEAPSKKPKQANPGSDADKKVKETAAETKKEKSTQVEDPDFEDLENEDEEFDDDDSLDDWEDDDDV